MTARGTLRDLTADGMCGRGHTIDGPGGVIYRDSPRGQLSECCQCHAEVLAELAAVRATRRAHAEWQRQRAIWRWVEDRKAARREAAKRVDPLSC